MNDIARGELLDAVRLRCRATIESLVTSRNTEPDWANKPSAEAYDLAIDEVDKIAFWAATVTTNEMHRNRWLPGGDLFAKYTKT